MEIYFGSYSNENEVILNEEESHHCVTVMRNKAGDEIFATDGKGKLFKTKIQVENSKRCILLVESIAREEKIPEPSVHIAITLTKSLERFEWFLEKATEIGISEITPIICKRSERTKIKAERCEKIILSAMKQSLRLWLPKLNPLIKFDQLATSNLPDRQAGPKPEARNFICHCQSQNLPELKSLYRKNENVLVLIGPEGDFTPDEINLAEQKGFGSVSLGEARLRTETAGLVALQTIWFVNGEK